MIFGIEASTSALLSPTHLVLVVGAVLIYLGPLRSVIARDPGRTGWAENGPLIFSLLWLLSSFTFFTQYASPYASTLASARRIPPAEFIDLFHALGVAGVALQAAFLCGVILYAVKIGRVPAGCLHSHRRAQRAVLMTFDAVDMLSVSPLVLTGAAIAAGVLIDLLYAWLRPQDSADHALKIFAFTAPAIVYALYFVSSLRPAEATGRCIS